MRMDQVFTPEDLSKIQTAIKARYSKVAETTKGLFRYPTGNEGLRKLRYDAHALEKIPDEIADLFCGVGNPFTIAELQKGDTVLDIGSGIGIDCFVAAHLVGSEGKVYGIDLTGEMVTKAIAYANQLGFTNVYFQEGSGEKIPFSDNTFDAIISNGVFNLVPNKLVALKEVLRVLKPSGRFAIGDQILKTGLAQTLDKQIDNWAG
jgi:arsenite methyltransferase